ncbi:hypothetical protein Hanom_Chr14g01300421 [Helianthus anomalus]
MGDIMGLVYGPTKPHVAKENCQITISPNRKMHKVLQLVNHKLLAHKSLTLSNMISTFLEAN